MSSKTCKVIAHIRVEGILQVFELPPEARYIVQNKHGQWFWCEKKARITFVEKTNIPDDWFSSKHPIQIKVNGYDRVLATDKPLDWKTTQVQTIVDKNMPNYA